MENKQVELKVPECAWPWNVRYARWDGGIVHVCKGANSGWDAYLNDPDVMAAAINLYLPGSAEFLKRMHINWVWVTWSVGFSHEMESRSQKQLAEYIRCCGENGIRCSAYVSMGNVFVDDILRFRPDLYDCRAIHSSGDWLTYGDGAPMRGKPRRRMMCVSNRPWRDYVLEKCRSAIGAGAAAVFFDNCIEGCVCENCQRNYADYTEKYWGERMEMPKLETGWEMDVIKEANQQARYRFEQAEGQREIKLMQSVRLFEHWQYDEFLAEIDAEIKKINPEAFVYRNTNLGIDCFRSGPSTVLFTENASEPGLVEEKPPIFEGYPFNQDEQGRPKTQDFLSHIYKAGRLVNNIGFYSYLRAAAGASRVVRVEPQGRADGTQSRYVPLVPRRIRLGIAEAAACGVNIGRHMDGGIIKEIYWGTELGERLMDGFGLYNRFLEEHTELYEVPASVADCLVVINDNTQSVEVLNRLASQYVVFDVAFPDELTFQQLQEYRQVIVPDYMEWFGRKEVHYVPYVSDEVLQILIDFAKAGRSVYVAEQIGLYDEHLDPQKDSELRDELLSTANVNVLPVPGEEMPDDETFIETIRSKTDLPVRVGPARGVLGITNRVRDGRLVVHIINYGGKASGAIKIQTKNKCNFAAISPDGRVELKRDGENSWLVGSVDIYTVLYEEE